MTVAATKAKGGRARGRTRHRRRVICVIGTAALDRNLLVRRIPLPGDELGARESGANPGGQAANTAARAAALGSYVRLICRLGDDEPGRAVLAAAADLRSLTVDTQPAQQTATSLILITPDGERTIVFCKPAERTDPDPAAVGAVSADVSWIDVPDSVRRDAFHTLTAASTRGLPLQHLAAEANAGRRWELAVGSSDDCPDVDEALLMTAGVRLAVVTEGSNGGRWWTPTRGWQRFAPAACVGVVDTCGAGDAFCGGLLTALDLRWPAPLAVAAAAWAGARAVEHPGSWPTEQRALTAVDLTEPLPASK